MAGSAAAGYSPSPTEKVTYHVKPGRTRAPFFRYFQFNLPKTTKVLLIVMIAAIGGLAVTIAINDFPPFPHAEIPLWIVAAFGAVFVILGVTTKLRIWDFGLVPALGAILIYIGGIFTETSPYVWHGAPKELAAGYTLMLLIAAAYLVFYWALNYGMIVASPDDQNFHD